MLFDCWIHVGLLLGPLHLLRYPAHDAPWLESQHYWGSLYAKSCFVSGAKLFAARIMALLLHVTLGSVLHLSYCSFPEIPHSLFLYHNTSSNMGSVESYAVSIRVSCISTRTCWSTLPKSCLQINGPENNPKQNMQAWKPTCIMLLTFFLECGSCNK